MKNTRTSLTLLTTLLVACSGSAAGAPDAAGDVALTGAQLYKMACARCHGPGGHGDGDLGVRIGVIPDISAGRLVGRYDTASLEALVRAGRGTMPPHRDRLGQKEIARVVAYVLDGVRPGQ